ncbi:endonuclease I [Pseudomonas fluvialis]|uniref:Endonuclease I n=1 Tax=Pseudomonas fluvialis TaxID=1793966 RepID=A0A2I0CLI1_9PSED|nr:endonuclease [Pseudomonas pharmacofabricae]PKF69981.1 endonuclease I [Pseudomonas pharmacofabricae]
MRSLAIALSCLALSSPAALASGQNQLDDAEQAIAQHFWSLYPQGGTTLYCATPFSGAHSTFTAAAVFSERQIKQAMRCATSNQCTLVNPKYPYMLADLHNYYPALTRVEQARRGAAFGTLAEQVEPRFADLDCAVKIKHKTIEPPDTAKGNVARAMFYMHEEYNLRLPGNLEELKAWHRMDPPDSEEQARNERIAQIQGTRNRFIDNPALADTLGRE